MKRLLISFVIITLLLSSCSMGDFCKISDVKIRIFNNITDVFVDEGNDAYFYASKPLADVCVYKMEWDYDNNCYKQIGEVASGITLERNDAIRIVFDNKNNLPYVRITFTCPDAENGERYIFEDEYGKLWVLTQENLENSD